MAEEALFYSRPVFGDGKSRSEAEIGRRCDQIERELRTLLPALALLKNAVLDRRLRTAGHALHVDFVLTPGRQDSFAFGSLRSSSTGSRRAALADEVRKLIASAQQTQVRMDLIAEDLSLPSAPELAQRRSERKLRKEMKQWRGKRLHLELLQPDLDLIVPNTPDLVVSNVEMRIKCRILDVGRESALASDVVPLDDSAQAPLISRKQHYRLGFPAGEDNLQRGIALLTSAFQRRPVELDVYACYEPLLSIVTDFLIAKESDAERWQS